MSWIKNIYKARHTCLMWFWILNFPLSIVLYIYTDEKILLLYTVLCSVYANAETSAAAKEAKASQE